ncbi:hypothetical protein [Bradyrhizobium sp.]|uniref:hypothetical protein n=1 Tax=Bradyrhizobium sp. TaxID=376 RepID=UPI003C636863
MILTQAKAQESHDYLKPISFMIAGSEQACYPQHVSAFLSPTTRTLGAVFLDQLRGAVMVRRCRTPKAS